MQGVCVGIKAHMGWVNAVAVLVDEPMPAPVYAGRVDLLGGDDRAVLEPYHVAGGWAGLRRVPRPPDPAAVIRHGRRRQAASARKSLAAFRSMLAQKDLQWARAVVLTGRGRVGIDLDRLLASHAQVHVAEGEAIREATRAALDAMQVVRVDQDEKRVPAEAQRLLGAGCEALVKGARPAGAKVWGREERLIALAAWLHRRRADYITDRCRGDDIL